MTFPNTFRLKLNALPISNARRLTRDEGGQALFETAVSFLLLATVIFGLIVVSWAGYSYHFVANAAHEATRYAIVRGGGWGIGCSGYTSSMCTASTDDIANYVASLNFPGITVTASDVCVQYFSSVPSSVSTLSPPCPSASAFNAPGDIVQVTITYPFNINIPGVPASVLSLTSTSQMVITQ